MRSSVLHLKSRFQSIVEPEIPDAGSFLIFGVGGFLWLFQNKPGMMGTFPSVERNDRFFVYTQNGTLIRIQVYIQVTHTRTRAYTHSLSLSPSNSPSHSFSISLSFALSFRRISNSGPLYLYQAGIHPTTPRALETPLYAPGPSNLAQHPRSGALAALVIAFDVATFLFQSST